MNTTTKPDKNKNADRVLVERARRSLSEFVRDGWPIVEPGTPLEWNWHIDAICEHLEAVTRGDIQRLLINVPPGHMKSLIVSVFWPAWVWINKPEWRGLFSSYAMELALRDSVRCRDIVRSDWYRQLFRIDWTLKADENNKGLFVNTRKGFRFSMSVGGRATGFRGDCTVVDDPLNAKDQWSQTAREECLFWWDQVMSSRLNDLRKGGRVIIMQRLHEDDLSGHVLRKGGYEHLCLPSEFDPERRSVTSIGWRDPRIVSGELLFPKLFPACVLDQAKRDLGVSGFAGQHQQLPAPAEGAIFKAGWFVNRYRSLPAFKSVASFWDTAIKASESNDESACITIGVADDGNPYILRSAHGRWETPDLAKFLTAQADWLKQLYGESYQGDFVEDKASGSTLVQYVRRSRPDLVLISVAVEGDKVSRCHGVTPLCEAGRVLLPDPEVFPVTRDWSGDLVAQLLSFPSAQHDDQVDAFVYALKWFLGTLNRKRSRRGRTGGVV